MDIGLKKGFPESNLSNLHPHAFCFDGVECASMEGLLQSFKFEKVHIQREVCKLSGLEAKFRGKKRNKAWKRIQTLWWNGRSYNRDSREYQELLDQVYDALAQQNAAFRKALLATGNAALTHSLGKSDIRQTVLTEREFCSRLEKIRTRLQKEAGL